MLWHQRRVVGEVADGCLVVANASPNMGVRVQGGTFRIPTGTAPANYWYEAAIDTASPGEALTVSTANPSNPRRDLVVAYIDKSVTRSTSFTNNSNAVLKLAIVAGTAAASPADPNTSQIQAAIGAANPFIILGRVLVGTGVTTITNAVITDLRNIASPAYVNFSKTNVVNPYRFSAYRNAAASSPAASTVIVGYNAVDYDPNQNFDVSTNVGRYTAPVDGLYQFTGRVRLQAPTNRIFLAWIKNGSSYTCSPDVNGSAYGISDTLELQLVAGNTIEVQLFTGNSQSLDVSNRNTSFSGRLLSHA